MPAHFSPETQMHAVRRVLPMDEALSWLFIDELPKMRDDDTMQPRMASMHPMWKGGLFTKVDNWSREPGMPLALGDPHPDAERIAAELKALDPDVLDISGYGLDHGYQPGAISGSIENIVNKARGDLRATIARAAKRRQPPSLEHFAWCEPVTSAANGKPSLWATATRQVGETPAGKPIVVTEAVPVRMESGGHYRTGTFCKLNWVSGADDDIEVRARYALHHAAMCWLAEHLRTATRIEVGRDGKEREVPLLDTIVPRPPRSMPSPWIFTPPEPRVLWAVPTLHGVEKPVPPVAPLHPLRPGHSEVRVIPREEWPAAHRAA